MIMKFIWKWKINNKIIKKLPTGEDIVKQIPLSKAGYESIEQNKKEIRKKIKVKMQIGHLSIKIILCGLKWTS